MFNARYFGRRYFAARYWAKVGSGDVLPVPVVTPPERTILVPARSKRIIYVRGGS